MAVAADMLGVPPILRRPEMATGHIPLGRRIFARQGDLAKLLIAIVHRGCVAATTLIVTIYAGRALPPAEFGTFAVLMGLYPLVLVAHSSFFTEPMLVFGDRYRSNARRYRSLLGRAQAGFGIGCALLLLAGGLWFFPQTPTIFGILALAAALPLVLAIEFGERYALMRLRPELAAQSAALQLIGAILAVLVLDRLQLATLPSIVGIAGLVVLVPGALLLAAVQRTEFGANEQIDGAAVWRQSIAFGRHAFVAQLLTYLSFNAYILVIPFVSEISDAGMLRAQSVLTGPAVQAFSALGVLAIPLLRGTADRHAFWRKARFLGAIVAASGLAFWLLVGLFGHLVVPLVFAGDYSFAPEAYWLIGAYPVIVGLTFLLGSILRSVERPGLVVAAAAASVILTLLPGIWLVASHGAIGAILGQTIGAAVMLVAGLFVLRHAAMTGAP